MLRGHAFRHREVPSRGKGRRKKNMIPTKDIEKSLESEKPSKPSEGKKKRGRSKENTIQKAAEEQLLFEECDIGVDKNKPLIDCVRSGEELAEKLNEQNIKIEQRVFGSAGSAISQKEYEALCYEQRQLGEKIRLLDAQLRLLGIRAQHTFHEYSRSCLEASFDPSLQAIAGGSFGNGCTDF